MYFQLNPNWITNHNVFFFFCNRKTSECVYCNCLPKRPDISQLSAFEPRLVEWKPCSFTALSPAQCERHSLTDYYVLCLAAQSALSSARLPWQLFCLRWSCQHDHFVSLGSLDAFARPWPAVSPGLTVFVCVCVCVYVTLRPWLNFSFHLLLRLLRGGSLCSCITLSLHDLEREWRVCTHLHLSVHMEVTYYYFIQICFVFF